MLTSEVTDVSGCRRKSLLCYSLCLYHKSMTLLAPIANTQTAHETPKFLNATSDTSVSKIWIDERSSDAWYISSSSKTHKRNSHEVKSSAPHRTVLFCFLEISYPTPAALAAWTTFRRNGRYNTG